MSALHSLSGVLEERGRYDKAEAAAREVLPWLQGHEVLGSSDSPQALGCMKVLVRCMWKQSEYAEAEGWIEKCNAMIENLGKGKFAKYQDDERKEFDHMLHALKAWKEDHDRQSLPAVIRKRPS